MAILEAGRLNGQAFSAAPGFRVDFVRDWRQAAAQWHDYRSPTPFQEPRWLDAWYQAFADADDVEPLIAIVSDAATLQQVAILSLIRRVQNGIRIV